MTIVAIGGLSGGGGRKLGPILAERLSLDYVDRLVLAKASAYVSSTVAALQERESHSGGIGSRVSEVFRRVMERSAVTGVGGDPYFGPGILSYLTDEFETLSSTVATSGSEVDDSTYFDGINLALHEVASDDDVVIVGRGSYIILRDMPGIVRIGTVADLEDRVTTIMEREGLAHNDALALIEGRDQARVKFFQKFLHVDHPDDPHLYDIVLNTSSLSVEHCVEIAADLVKIKSVNA